LARRRRDSFDESNSSTAARLRRRRSWRIPKCSVRAVTLYLSATDTDALLFVTLLAMIAT
jgi:hypothetical protein